jgi:DNA-damage-inducible protein D
MKREQIDELFERFEQAAHEVATPSGNIECWSARELQPLFGYGKWENFIKVIDKAKEAALHAGERVPDHFPDVRKMVSLGSGAERAVEDIALTRYACYLIAQNGDSRKQEIAFAQTYFAVQTRKQELIEQRLLEHERVQARRKLVESEKKLSGVIYERGVDERSFALIRSKGDQALFGGLSTQEMKRKYRVPEGRPLADFLPTLTIKAKDFATELTSHNVVDKDISGEVEISREHIDNNLAVRKLLAERGVKPEALPPAEDVKKVQRRLDSEDKKALRPKSTE